jgi:hypothetical protein
MEALIKFLNKFRALDFGSIKIKEIYNSSSFFFEVQDYVLQDQLFERGINADGKIIGYYSATTEFLSGGEKKEGTPYTLKDTGEFYESFKIEASDDGFVINADGEKIGGVNLFDQYGEEIVGLTEENLERLTQLFLKDRVLENIHDYLQNY